MLVRLVCTLSFVVFAGCLDRVSESTAPTDVVQPQERLGVEASKPQLVGDVYRIELHETPDGESYTADQLGQLPVGEMCHVKIAETGRVISGRIATVKEDILVLEDAEEIIIGVKEEGVPAVSKIPYVARMFKNVGVGVERRFLGSQTISSFEIDSIRVEPLPFHKADVTPAAQPHAVVGS